MEFSRRRFLTCAGASVGGLLLRERGYAAALDLFQATQPAPIRLQAVTRTLDINGKSASVLGLLQPNGTHGLEWVVNQLFRVVLENKLTEPTAIHWHGLYPPNNEDGVPGVTQPVIRPNESSFYNFPVIPAGTHWMHSHQGLQEARLLSAPLIVHDSADQSADVQQVIVFFRDFSFTPPKEIYAQLTAPKKAMAMGGKMASKPDANDVNYDAYLANDRTLDDPDVVRVEKSGRVRLRIINGSSGTNYFVDLGGLTGELIATDGLPVKPIRASRFPLAIAQRIDVMVQIPPGGGAFPILALREGSREQTGVFLATAGAPVKRLPVKGTTPTGLLTLDQESQLSAVTPLTPKAVDQTSVLRLQGNMAKYQWMINDIVFDVNNPGAEKSQAQVKMGQRVALKFVNETPMSHPMHLHGHAFEVIEINGRPLQGAMRDTILVPGNATVTVAFDANNPGLWFLHCHIIWHLEAGMAALVKYEA
ncbi:MAG: multicopper oxidase family protein [Candidatus Korobacteraceae bacterium]